MNCKAGHEHDTFAEAAECDRDAAIKRQIAKTRDALASLRAVKHDHHGVCPVCSPLRDNTADDVF